MSRFVCPRCQRPPVGCLCPWIPQLAHDTRVLVLQHPSERHHALNTARLAVLGLTQATLLVGEHFPDAPWRHPDDEPWLLFPGDAAGAVPVMAAATVAAMPVPQGRTRLLVVPDGSWRKAARLLHANPDLDTLPRLSLPAGAPSRYRLRRAPNPEALSTVEAIARALTVLDAPRDFTALLHPFERLIDQQIAAMGTDTYTRNYGARLQEDT